MSDKGGERLWADTAFPSELHEGLTKREFFAAFAPAYPFKLPMLDPFNDARPMEIVARLIAAWNVAYADALIAELAKREP